MVYKELKAEDFMHDAHLTRKDIPKLLIVDGHWNISGQMRKFRQNLTKVRKMHGFWGNFAMVGNYKGEPLGYSVVYGAPIASEIVHAFALMGTRYFLQIGSFGALRKGMRVGDFLIPTKSEKGDGASQYYAMPHQIADSSKDMNQILIEILGKAGHAYHIGPMYSTSAMLGETKEMIADWNKKGYLGVDLETAATFAVAKHFGAKRAGLLRMIDNVVEDKHVLMELPAEEEKRHQQSKKDIVKHALAFFERLP